MAYQGTVRRCLISSPSDVPEADLAIVHKTINHWNGIYGERYGSVIIPISWGSHAAAEFGRGPQAILNDQLVDSCDMCIAMFWARLGTPTAENESGPPRRSSGSAREASTSPLAVVCPKQSCIRRKQSCPRVSDLKSELSVRCLQRL
jgi:hypothetical protein